MRSKPPLPLLKRVPPGVWAGVLWGTDTASMMRGYAGIPGMPGGLPPLALWSWPLMAAATVAALTGCVLLRRRPLTALALLIAGTCAAAMVPVAARIGALHTELGVLHLLAIDVAVGFVVATGPRRSWIVAYVLALGALPGYAIVRWLSGASPSMVGDPWADWQLFALTTMVAGLIGHSSRRRRQYLRRLSEHVAAQAVTGERLRISRELHDMVAHSIGIIALQAGAAARVMDTQPAEARAAMIAVETTGRETLSGLRRMLGTLRYAEPDQAGPAQEGDGASLHPAPGLADVDRLAAATTAAGVRVDVRWQGERRPLPPDIELSAYRIIQESVTNVVRHAAAPCCQVSVDYRDTELAIEVTDLGQGGDPTTAIGYGLAGMRERAVLLHGDLTAGPGPDGGFRVTARLPVPKPAQSTSPRPTPAPTVPTVAGAR